MSAKTIYEEGQRFGFLKLIEEVEPHISPSGQSKRKFKFICDCGEETYQIMNNVKRGKVVSCGCYHDTQSITHGASSTETYKIWLGIKQRCYNEARESYEDYGGRGVRVCDRWLESFENFLEDMGERPKGMSIDRINVDGDYEPANCRWTAQTEQVFNRRKLKSKTGYTGITLKSGKFYVKISKDKRVYCIGSYPTLKEAVEARINAELDLYSQIKTVWEG